jgi:hypothetical protein
MIHQLSLMSNRNNSNLRPLRLARCLSLSWSGCSSPLFGRSPRPISRPHLSILHLLHFTLVLYTFPISFGSPLRRAIGLAFAGRDSLSAPVRITPLSTTIPTLVLQYRGGISPLSIRQYANLLSMSLTMESLRVLCFLLT